MSADCAVKSTRSRNNESAVLHGVASIGYSAIQGRLSWDKSKCSRFFKPGDGEPARATLEEFLAFLEIAGIELIDGSSGSRTVSIDELEALKTLARKALA